MKTFNFRRLICLLSLTVLCVSFMGNLVQALPQEQREVFDSGIYRYDYAEQDCGNAAGATGQGFTDGTGVDRFLQVLAHQESGGNPKAANPGSSARGKYQYITSTWHAHAKDYYPPADAYSTADVAPEAVQDALAKIEYTEKFVAFGSDLFKLAISHFYPAANSDPSKLDDKIGSNSITPRGYANSIINKIKTGVGIGIGLHYIEAPEFKTFFNQISTEGSETPVQPIVGDTSGTTAAPSVCGQQGAVAGGDCGDKTLRVPAGGSGVTVCNYKQAALSGGNYNWPGCGCLPTSVLNIRATMEKSPTLDHLTVLGGMRAAGGVYTDGCSGVIGGAVNYLKNQGYKVDPIQYRGGTMTDSSLQRAKEALGKGQLILAHTSVSVDSAGDNATSGHFLVVHAVDAQGNFYVANPGATADNGKPVSPARMKAWLDEFFAVSK